MADRPRGNGGPEDGTPEYNWLYGNKGGSAAGADATRAVPQQPRGDETRVMPASGGPASAPPQGRSSRPTPPPLAPPPGGKPKPSRGFRFPKPRLRWIFILFLAWIVYLVAVPL